MSASHPSEEFRELLTRMKNADKEAIEVLATLDTRKQKGDPAWHRWTKRLEQLMSEAQSIMLSAQQRFGTYTEFDVAVRAAGYDYLMDDHVVTLSICLESEHIDHIEFWIGDDLRTMFRTDDHESQTIMQGRNVTRILQTISGGLLSPLPNIFADGRFRHGFLHQQLFKPLMETQLEDLLLKCHGSSTMTAITVNALHDAEQHRPISHSVLKSFIAEKIVDMPVTGLEVIHKYVTGTDIPSGDDCSTRVVALFRQILLGTIHAECIATRLKDLQINQRYFKEVFFEEIAALMEKYCSYYNDNERGDEYSAGASDHDAIQAFLKLAIPSDKDLATLCLRVTVAASKGLVMDLQDRSVKDRFLHVMADVTAKQSKYTTFNPDGNLRHAILKGAMKCLPTELLAEIAQANDSNRTLLYTITGEPRYLKGIQDKKHLDQVFGTDLGL